MIRTVRRLVAAHAAIACLLIHAPHVQAQPLTVVGDQNYPPYLFRDQSGDVSGYIADLWKLWAQTTGTEVNLIATQWDDAQKSVLDGKADVIEMIFRTPDRESIYSFSAPYATVKAAIYTVDGMSGISTPTELAGFVVGVQEGDACVSRLRALGVNDLRLYDNYQQLIGDMLARNVRIMCMDEYPANYYLYRHVADQEIRKAFTFYTDHFRRAVKKGELATLDMVEQGMARIDPEKLQALKDKWMGVPIHPTSPSYLVLYGLIISLVLGGILAAWIALLRMAVRKKTREIQAQANQIEAERDRFEEMIDAARAGTWEWNIQTGECQFNERWANMLGYRLEELMPVSFATWQHLIHPDDLPLATEAIEKHLSGKSKYYEIDFRMRHKDGRWIWLADRGQLVSRTPAGLPLLMRGTHIDINESKLADEIIQWQANYDSLTHLPNRRMFNERLTEAVKRAESSLEKVALLTIDIDQFKEINDSFGHLAGDELIVSVSQSIQKCLRDSDTVARFSGDEFNVILITQSDLERIHAIAQRILDSVASPRNLGDEQVYVHVSIGISVYPDDASNVDEILRHADMAMYVAKRSGGNRFSFYTSTLQDALNHRTQLIRDLRRAFEASQFLDYYQPIVDLATGRIYKAELLLRWNHPVRGFITPTEFIPVAEDSGLITDIGDWIITRAVANAKAWIPLGGKAFAISVNKSPVEFRNNSPHQLDWVDYLKAEGLPGENIVLEITEGLLLRKDPAIADKLRRFAEAGVKVAVDDFGTGYSSLAYLSKFDIDYLKIDQSFIAGLSQGNESHALCEAIVVMAHKLGIKAIAEGVETVVQRDLLIQMGCDYAQGYLYSKPLPAEDFRVLLERQLADDAPVFDLRQP